MLRPRLWFFSGAAEQRYGAARRSGGRAQQVKWLHVPRPRAWREHRTGGKWRRAWLFRRALAVEVGQPRPWAEERLTALLGPSTWSRPRLLSLCVGVSGRAHAPGSPRGRGCLCIGFVFIIAGFSWLKSGRYQARTARARTAVFLELLQNATAL